MGESWGSILLRVLKNTLLIAIGVAAGTTIVCWAMGWRTPYQVGQGMLFAGLACVGLGLLSTMGTWNIRGSFSYQFSRSAGLQKIGDRLEQDIHDLYGSNAFMINTLLGGILVILLGLFLQRLS